MLQYFGDMLNTFLNIAWASGWPIFRSIIEMLQDIFRGMQALSQTDRVTTNFFFFLTFYTLQMYVSR